MIAFVITNGLPARREFLRETGAADFGSRIRARGDIGAVSVERGRGGGTEGGGKFTCLVWQFLGVTAM